MSAPAADTPVDGARMLPALPALPPLSARRSRRAGVYVHFPYCLAKCPYCDFVSYVSREPIDHRAYAEAVLRELDRRAPGFGAGSAPPPAIIESIFFGGGTPSLWDPLEVGRVISGIRGAFGGRLSPALEVTAECNPTSLDEARATQLLAAGVNRLSIGVQSLQDDRLRFLGRLHDAAGARRALGAALAAGFSRVSGDLIFGLPGQAPAQACDDALALVDLGVSHVSAYQLTIEPRTQFGELARRGRLPLADEGSVAQSFVAIDEALGARGFAHYEVSNYALPGEEARHNLGYWRGDEYLGLGCGAYGFRRSWPAHGEAHAEPAAGPAGIRWRNADEPEAYVRGDAQAEESREGLDAELLLRERIMLGLRVRGGIDVDEAAGDLGLDRGWTPERERACAWLVSRERVVREGSRVRIPPAAWLWTDDTAARLF